MKIFLISLMLFSYSIFSYSIELDSKCELLKEHMIPEDLFASYKSIMPSLSVIEECHHQRLDESFRRGYSMINNKYGYCFYEIASFPKILKIQKPEVRTFVSFGYDKGATCETKSYSSFGNVIEIHAVNIRQLEKYFTVVHKLDNCLNSPGCVKGLLRDRGFFIGWFDQDHKEFSSSISDALKNLSAIEIDRSSFVGLESHIVTTTVSIANKYRWALQVDFVNHDQFRLISVNKLMH